jgi:glycosyltransferase involved in cell wall biosynthesis
MSRVLQPVVSVVTPTYNRRTSLDRLLQGLRKQTYSASQFELVAVDDGSSDGTVEHLRGLELPYAMRVFQQAHAGPAVARNLGVAQASGRLILFLDDDVLPVPTLIEEHVRTHADATDLVVIGPMSPPLGWPRPAWIKWDEETLKQQYRDMLAGEWACTPRQFYTANASVDRARLVRSGGFDGNFKRAEDVELAFRLQENGARFTFNPRAEIVHFASRSFAAWRRTAHQYGRYDVIMQRDKGTEMLNNAYAEFHLRHRLNRLVIRLCLGRPIASRSAVAALSAMVLAADSVGAARAARWALSGIFSVRYWQGVSDEIGSSALVLRSINEHRPAPRSQFDQLR